MPFKDPIRRKEYHREYGKRTYKEYYAKNIEVLSEKSKKYHIEHRDTILERQRLYRINNIEKIKVGQRKYHRDNKDVTNRYLRNKIKTDINFKLKHTLRSRLRCAIKNNQKAGSAVKDLGCTISEFKIHIEKQFKLGMTWDNWSKAGWHIDHEIPLDAFDLTDIEQFLQACHYTNLQPMWAKENLEKKNKLIWPNNNKAQTMRTEL